MDASAEQPKSLQEPAEDIPLHRLEDHFAPHDAVSVRREMLSRRGVAVDRIPHGGICYESIRFRNCENVIGHLPVPIGIAGPLTVNGREVYLPLATTEGALVASVNRGCKALVNVACAVLNDEMTRGPMLMFDSLAEALDFDAWLRADLAKPAVDRNLAHDPADARPDVSLTRSVFMSASAHTVLNGVDTFVVGKRLYLRFAASTSEAMGMNILTKATERCLLLYASLFTSIQSAIVSANVCTDKKPSAINWVCGRGKSVTCEATVTHAAIRGLKTTAKKIYETYKDKCLLGSAVSGSLGGQNCQAANVVSALFLACGQDIAQSVTSSQCLLAIDLVDDGLCASLYMPCIEVGVVGGGTHLPPQNNCIQLAIGQAGAPVDHDGTQTGIDCEAAQKSQNGACKHISNAQLLAQSVCAAVLAGEVSLLAALSANQLASSHLRLNRKQSADAE